MENIKNKDIELMNVSEEDKFIKNFKSMYYLMNAKPDSTTKIFQKEVIIGLDNIWELNDLVMDKFKMHYVDSGFSISIVVSYSDRKSLEFNNWTEFKNHNWIESHDINSITLLWDFNLMLPGYKVPQRHKVMVKLSNGMRPEQILNIILSGNLEDLDETNVGKDFFPIVARVDFISSLLGDEFLNIVAKWVDGLKTANENRSKFILKLQKNKKKISYLVNYLIILLSVILEVIYLNVKIESCNIKTIGDMTTQQFTRIINIVFIMIITYFVLTKIFGVIANVLFEQLQTYGEHHMFYITKGDKNKQQRIMSKEKEQRNSILFKVLGSFVLNVICGLITGYLLK